MKSSLLTAGLILLTGLSLSECAASKQEVRDLLAVEKYDAALQQVADNRWRILANVARSERAARAALEAENEDMAGEIRRLRGRLSSVTTVTVTAPAETLYVAQVDTVNVRTGVRTYRLDWASGTTWVEADTVYSARHEPADQTLTLAIYRLPDRSWWADADLQPYGRIADMRITVSEPKQTFWERYDLWIGAGIGLAVTAGVVWLVK